MNRLAVAFTGACSLLLACVVHDDATFQNPPPSTESPPTRSLLDAGLFVLSDDGGEVIVGGGAGTYTPDAAEVVDAATAAPDLAGLGLTCHPLLGDCLNQTLVCYPGANGTGFCYPPGSGGELANCSQSSDCVGGYYCGNGRTASNICMLLCDVANPGCVKSSPCVQVPGFKDNTGYCSE
jgi:hypothetical protein